MPTKMVGKYVKPKDWNALISDPDTVSVSSIPQILHCPISYVCIVKLQFRLYELFILFVGAGCY
jgi:hypothetical protein